MPGAGDILTVQPNSFDLLKLAGKFAGSAKS